MNPYFSVVIPTYNRLDMLLRVLTALENQVDAPPFEIIVVNDGSKDETEAVIGARGEGREARESADVPGAGTPSPLAPRPSPLIFRTQPNSGPSAARNHGVRVATGKFVVFIGDDTVPEPRFLAEHARVHRAHNDDRNVAVLGYTGWPREDRITAFMDYINDYGLQFGYKLIAHGDVVPFNFFYTSNISLDRELLAKYPFDTGFPSAAWEDIELAYRLDRLGLRIHYNEKAVTRHYHQMTVDSFSRRQYTVGKSGAIFAKKHPELSHFLGVQEALLPPMDDPQLEWLTKKARFGERFRIFAQPKVFEKVMREHYIRGLRDGLNE